MSGKKYRQGVFALIIDSDDNILLIQKSTYDAGQWTLIGGGRQEGETKQANLFREINEETRLEADNFIMLGESSSSHKYDYPRQLAMKLHGGKYVGQSYSIFALKLKSPKSLMKFNESEISKSKWVPIRELDKYLNFPGQYRNIIRAVDEFVK